MVNGNISKVQIYLNWPVTDFRPETERAKDLNCKKPKIKIDKMEY